MGKASSAKKIARAQRAGANTGPSERRDVGFPIVVVTLMVVGLLLVGWARASRDAQASPTLQDHWHDAYAVWDCVTESFLPPFESQVDPLGIHSHVDGLIHIHPFTSSVTGKGATMGVFLDAMGVSVTPDAVELPGGQALEAGAECGGEPSVIQVVRWTDVLSEGEPVEVITEDFDAIGFTETGEGFTIARAPLGADVPIPNSLDALAAVIGQNRDEGIEPPTDTEVVPPQDFGLDGPLAPETDDEPTDGETTDGETTDGETTDGADSGTDDG